MNKLSDHETLAILMFGEFIIESPEDLPEDAQQLAQDVEKYLISQVALTDNKELMRSIVSTLRSAIDRVKAEDAGQ